MPDRKNQDRLGFLLDTVQSQIARPTAGDHQLSQAMLDRATHHRVVPEDLNGLFDQADGLGCCRRIGGEQEIRESFEIGECLFGIDQRRHDRGFGRAGFLPATRAAR
jgi:hypothetical protein